MRAIAALGVICWHYVHAFGSAPLGHVLAPFYGRGLLMVDFFFVLSGFVLARAFWTVRRAPHFATNVRARIARMYPLHAATLCVVAVLQCYLVIRLGAPSFAYQHNDIYHFALNALLLNASGLQQGFSFNAPAWSISTEFLVNVAFLGLIALPRGFARAGLVLLGVVAVATMATRGVINGTRAFGIVDNDLIRTVAGFMVGVATALVHSRVRWKLTRWASDLLAIVIAAGCGIYLATPGLWSNLGDMAVCFIGFPTLVLSVIASGRIRTMLRIRLLVYLGEISYSIYLVHFPLQLALHVLALRADIPLPVESRLFFAGFIGMVIAVASCTHRFIEIPGKRRLMSGRVSSSLA
jgi:peptidoglycan/LPS O-acetylase OafA/YrhL